jgi:hypothetical protein
MKLSNEQLNDLRVIISGLISLDKTNKKEIAYDDIDNYINRALAFAGLEIDKEDRDSLFTEIEYQNKITHTADQVIFDDYDNLRDWYHRDGNSDNYFWNRYYQYLVEKSNLDQKSINRMDFTTLPQIMNCLGNPKEDFKGKRLRRGLIIGDVQSGKTATYTGLICKAADAGYKVVILLAGITESLRKQTQERIDEGIIGRTKVKVGKIEKTMQVGVGLDNKPLKATSFTSCVSDFVANTDKIATSLEEHKSLVIFVIKKNVSVLQKLLNWLKDYNLDPVKQYVDQPMLLIDDEADNASVNTRKDETDPTRTNKLIRNICDLFKNATYVGFTATPFANVFIDPDSVDSMKRADLFPEHFIYVLPTPSTYIGAEKIFDPNGSCHSNLRYISDIEEPDYFSQEYKDAKEEDPESLNCGTFYYKHLKEWHGKLPNSLHQAILCFYLANVVRDLRGEIEKPRSMLVNMSRFVKVQKYIKEYVEEQHNAFLSTVTYDFSEKDDENKSLPLYKELEKLWNDNFSNISDIKFDRVIRKKSLLDAVSNIEIMVVNGGKSSGKLNYKTNKSLRVIAIGGLALSRGLTLEGLLISYFYRNTATFDVLMQMGRWFGYRPHYSDLFRIWISHISADWYNEVAKASKELKEDIEQMNLQKLTPKDFGIKVRDFCDDLQITASNKMRNASDWFEYTYWGSICDTPYVSRSVEQNKKNWTSVKKLSQKLFRDGYKFLFADQRQQANEDVNSESAKSRYFADVPKDIIVDFLSTINCSLMNPKFITSQILDFLKDSENTGLDKWDVVFEGGDGKLPYDIPGLEKIKCVDRAIYANGNVVQISSRRRLLGTREGKFTLTEQQIKQAEERQRNAWIKEDGEDSSNMTRAIPVKAYFEYLPDRKPILVIMLIETNAKDDENTKATETQRSRFSDFVDKLGEDRLVAFAIGFPGRGKQAKYKKYKANKVFQKLNMFDEEDELEDEE